MKKILNEEDLKNVSGGLVIIGEPMTCPYCRSMDIITFKKEESCEKTTQYSCSGCNCQWNG